MKRWLVAAAAALGALGALITSRWRSGRSSGETAAKPAAVPRPSVVDEVAGKDEVAEQTVVAAAGSAATATVDAEAGDGLQAIKGIGPAMEARLASIGVTSVAQLASATSADEEAMAAGLQVAPERVAGWVRQARGVASTD